MGDSITILGGITVAALGIVTLVIKCGKPFVTAFVDNMHAQTEAARTAQAQTDLISNRTLDMINTHLVTGSLLWNQILQDHLNHDKLSGESHLEQAKILKSTAQTLQAVFDVVCDKDNTRRDATNKVADLLVIHDVKQDQDLLIAAEKVQSGH